MHVSVIFSSFLAEAMFTLNPMDSDNIKNRKMECLDIEVR